MSPRHPTPHIGEKRPVLRLPISCWVIGVGPSHAAQHPLANRHGGGADPQRNHGLSGPNNFLAFPAVLSWISVR